MNWLIEQIQAWLNDATVTTLNDMWTLLIHTLAWVPDVTGLPQVTHAQASCLLIVNTVYVVAVMAAAVMVMTRETLQIRYGIGELGPRLVLGFVASNFAAPICSALITLANALTVALSGEDIASQHSLRQLQRMILLALDNPVNALPVLVIGLLLIYLSGLLLVGWLFRVARLGILAGIAPAALACHVLPQTDPLARLWWKAILADLGTVVLQTFVLHETMLIFLDPDANIPALGGLADQSPLGELTEVLNLVIVACMLWITTRIPRLMQRYIFGNSGNRNVLGQIIRLVVVQQLTRGIANRIGLNRMGPRAGHGPGGGRGPGSPGTAGPGGLHSPTGGPGGPGGPGGRQGPAQPYWRPRLPRATGPAGGPAGAARPRPTPPRAASNGPGQATPSSGGPAAAAAGSSAPGSGRAAATASADGGGRDNPFPFADPGKMPARLNPGVLPIGQRPAIPPITGPLDTWFPYADPSRMPPRRNPGVLPIGQRPAIPPSTGPADPWFPYANPAELPARLNPNATPLAARVTPPVQRPAPRRAPGTPSAPGAARRTGPRPGGGSDSTPRSSDRLTDRPIDRSRRDR